MSVQTKPIPCRQLIQQYQQQLPAVAFPLPALIEQSSRTDYIGPEDFRRENEASKLRFGLKCMSVATIAVLVSRVQANAEDDPSRSVNSQAMAGLTALAGSESKKSRAEFHEPIEFAWTKSAHAIRQAAKQFIENTHANY